MIVNKKFEQNHHSRTAEGILKIGHDNFRFMKWLIYYDWSYNDRFYHENMTYYDLMASVLTVLINEIS